MLIILGCILGLIVGSFLNVVIYRLPIMLEREWWAEYSEVAQLPPEMNVNEKFNLLVPRSRCGHCKKQIPMWHNIPIISFILLRGKCASCHKKISWRYPIVELLSGILSAVIVWHFGETWQMAAALLLTWGLIALSFIDIDKQILPDSINFGLLWVGLLISIANIFIAPSLAIISAVVGYGSLWLIAWIFQRVTGRVGMGHGDFKLLAMLGAWLGWQLLPFVIFFAALFGGIVGFAWHLSKQQDHTVPIPFGPFLAVAGWVFFLWGQPLLQLYWRLMGVNY